MQFRDTVSPFCAAANRRSYVEGEAESLDRILGHSREWRE